MTYNMSSGTLNPTIIIFCQQESQNLLKTSSTDSVSVVSVHLDYNIICMNVRQVAVDILWVHLADRKSFSNNNKRSK